MKILMTCGGTGGHINPAIAIADTIKANIPDSEFLFVGTKRGLESELVPEAGYDLRFVESMGFERSLSPKNIKALYLALFSPHMKSTKKIISDFRPDVVVGTGGYACWPIMKAAYNMGIPTVIHESNACPGVAVKRLQNSCDMILTCYDDTAQSLRKDCRHKVVKAGTPIRGRFCTVSRQEARKRLGIPDEIKYTVISYGGSGGADVLNDVSALFVRDFVSKHSEIMFVHATGTRRYESALKRFSELGVDLGKLPNVKIMSYIHDMPLYMAAADVVIARSGAMTLTELADMGKASILIPSPNVANDHQFKNAQLLASRAAAIVIRESSLTCERLTHEVCGLIGYDMQNERYSAHDAKINLMQKNISEFACHDANKKIYRLIVELASKKAKKI